MSKLAKVYQKKNPTFDVTLLFNAADFELVAEVVIINYSSVEDALEHAYKQTNHIQHEWWLNQDTHKVAIGPRRSTSVGDVVVFDGIAYMVDNLGFTQIP